MFGHLDLHAHVLPGVDDGPATESEAFGIIEAAYEAGTRQIVATPHVNERHYLEPEEITERVAAFNARLDAVGLEVTVQPGAEIALPRLLDLTDAQLELLVLGDGPYLLLESPLASSAGDFEGLIHIARARGFGVLLAHPERSPAFQKSPERLARLVEMGVLVQITTSSILGNFGESVRNFTLRLLRDDLVHVLASDTHDVLRRPPGLDGAMESAVSALPALAARADWLTRDAPAAILAGEPLPEPPPMPDARFANRRRRLSLAGRSR